MNKLRPVAIALGSNLGDRHAYLDAAVACLSILLSGARASRRIETAPVGVIGAQPLYLNAVVAGLTALAPRDVLLALQRIESEHGRQRPYVNAPRTLDLDLILYDDVVMDEPGLVVPHPRFRERAFVLEPLVDVAPGWCDPVTGVTMAELLARLRTAPPAPHR